MTKQVQVSQKQQSPLRPKGAPKVISVRSIKGKSLFEHMQTNEPVSISRNNLYQMFKRNADVGGCVREWRQNVGRDGYEWRVPNDPEAEVSEAIVEELDTMFNYWSSFKQLLDESIRDFGVAGEMVWYLNMNAAKTKVLAFQRLDPRTLTPVVDSSGFPIKYIQKTTDPSGVVKTTDIDALQIFHVKFEGDPDYGDIIGFSPMERCFWDAKVDLQALFSNYYKLENGGEPSAQYILDEGLSEEAYDEAMDYIDKQVNGIKNKGKSLALQGIKDVKTIAFTPKDMEYIAGRALTTEKVCAAYGVPKFKLGYTDKVNNNNGRELTANFYNDTIKPIEDLIAKEITRQILWRMGLKGVVEFVFKPRDLDDPKERFDRSLRAYQAGAMTLRQFKITNGMDITAEDEANPFIDEHIIHQGASAVLLSDVGLASAEETTDPQVAQNLLKNAMQS